MDTLSPNHVYTTLTSDPPISAGKIASFDVGVTEVALEQIAPAADGQDLFS